ncbi:MAG: bifunctional DNA-formamidopyrimidine glycosylase/DNA-(apurinic or apyrimidinic site) lyase [Burkholderiaceae bacterium]|nr:bifunctional DNA-formamidopyrimidine glycosylase/DNA-(apurinic or apyrimidinic site) lyase [Burkholderiaceae bacterium]
MPELPEVEVTRRSFALEITGARVESVRVGKPLRWPLGCDPQSLVGCKVLGLRRRGKYLLLDLNRGLLLLHLGMSGSVRFAPSLPVPGVHDHFELLTSQGVLRLHDPRRFGAVVYASGEQDPMAIKLLGGLGMEPLSDQFSLPAFLAGLQASRAAIKQLLLAGRVVVGVGNIYASEVLFLAKIHPATAASSIGSTQVQALYLAIREVLARAVEAGGTTLRDFSNANGMTGHFQQETHVYGRDNAPCHFCGTPIGLFKQGQRTTYFCPQCQSA